MRRRERSQQSSRNRRRAWSGSLLVAVVILVLTAPVARAQLPVTDVAVTFRNAATAVAQEYLLRVQDEQHRKLRQMAQRLSLFTDLRKYVLEEPPRWRTQGGDFLFANPYNDALIFGDTQGSAYLSLAHPLVTSIDRLAQLSPAARRAVEARLATVELTDAAAISATHDTGQLSLNGRRRELQAIDALERHVVDPSNEQSATAVLDKISGASLIGARQRQARIQLLTGVLEQLLVDSKRARDAEAAVLGTQLTTWREGRAANEGFMAGTGDALRTWRQP